jgi:DNA-binding NtrC family response regulator
MVAMSSPGPLGEAEVRRALTAGLAEGAPATNSETLEDAEKKHVMDVLRQSGGNRTLAAERLGIQRRTIYKKLQRWGLMHEGHTAVPGTLGDDHEHEH